MNSEYGLEPEKELLILRLSGVAFRPKFEHQPDGPWSEGCGPDARFWSPDENRWVYVEVRGKDCPLSRCKRPSKAGRCAGVFINVCEVANHLSTGPFLFVVADSDRMFYSATIDPATASERYPKGIERGGQDVFYIPVKDFETIGGAQ